MSGDELGAVEQFEAALSGDAIAFSRLSQVEREAVALSTQLSGFYARSLSHSRRRIPALAVGGLVALLLLGSGLGALASVGLGLAPLPWFAPADKVKLLATPSFLPALPRTTVDEALTGAPFPAVRPAVIPADFRAVDGMHIDGVAPWVALNYAGPRGTFRITEQPRSSTGLETVATAGTATTTVEMPGTTAYYAQGVWRLDGNALVWDPSAPGRSLFFSTASIIFSIEWSGGALTVEEAKEMAVALVGGDGRSR